VIGTLINHYLRIVDFKVAQRVDQFVANSEEVKRRIAKFYRKDSVVIYPPVQVPDWKDVQNWKKDLPAEGYFLYVNRLAFAKHPEMAIQACTELHLPLKVVGDGKLLPKLKEMAGPTVEFLGAVLDDDLHKLYAGATALLYPVEDEDFGIVPVEAMGHGIPVLAHRSGGPKETIVEGETGLFFDNLNTNALIETIYQFQKKKWDAKKIHEHAMKFSEAKFKEKILELVEKVLK
jgi:glycosyltransferase involved in cell wall biosynthesis